MIHPAFLSDMLIKFFSLIVQLHVFMHHHYWAMHTQFPHYRKTLKVLRLAVRYFSHQRF